MGGPQRSSHLSGVQRPVLYHNISGLAAGNRRSLLRRKITTEEQSSRAPSRRLELPSLLLFQLDSQVFFVLTEFDFIFAGQPADGEI
jgi:hypothetical protein